MRAVYLFVASIFFSSYEADKPKTFLYYKKFIVKAVIVVEIKIFNNLVPQGSAIANSTRLILYPILEHYYILKNGHNLFCENDKVISANLMKTYKLKWLDYA